MSHNIYSHLFWTLYGTEWNVARDSFADITELISFTEVMISWAAILFKNLVIVVTDKEPSTSARISSETIASTRIIYVMISFVFG